MASGLLYLGFVEQDSIKLIHFEGKVETGITQKPKWQKAFPSHRELCYSETYVLNIL